MGTGRERRGRGGRRTETGNCVGEWMKCDMIRLGVWKDNGALQNMDDENKNDTYRT